ncbi:hypothetical protein EDD29_4434 [Actinocorallia herbida]|uniref:Uncharacterized protein n=1 Tax=Actinocorallia herbida TaxID=58109 RepID=A0A3N1D019_9ACTN|nr:hypothetical protein [Actinocorallia herbida]ROO86852.1 hypothetical protein EDD29_4434 [Actinocorallia herbida]
MIVSGTPTVATRDGGATWELVEEVGERDAAPSAAPDRPEPRRVARSGESGGVCVVSAPDRCYRLVPGRVAVEESDDGARTWRTAWEIAGGRTGFLRRNAVGRGLSPEIAGRALAVQEVGGGHAVIVANGGDGIALRSVDGTWRRSGFPEIIGSEVAPVGQWDVPALVSPASATPAAIPLGLAAAALGVAAGLGADRKFAWGGVIAAVGLFLSGISPDSGYRSPEVEFLVALAARPVAFIALVAGSSFLVYAALSAPDGRRLAQCLALAVLTGLLAPLPLTGWTTGIIDDLRTASLLTIVLTTVGIAACYLIGRRPTARPDSERTQRTP